MERSYHMYFKDSSFTDEEEGALIECVRLPCRGVWGGFHALQCYDSVVLSVALHCLSCVGGPRVRPCSEVLCRALGLHKGPALPTDLTELFSVDWLTRHADHQILTLAYRFAKGTTPDRPVSDKTP
eukprot:2944415-Amphidinium_carterae.2